jgi:hypothetical protein
MVYPKTDVEVTYKDYVSGGHLLRFCAVDLGQDWRQIDQHLRQIIQLNNWFEDVPCPKSYASEPWDNKKTHTQNDMNPES